MEVRIIEDHKKDFLDLLLLADEQEDMIDRYLDRGTLFALYDNESYDNDSYGSDSDDNDSYADGLRSICVVTDEGNGVFEIQSLATYPEFRCRGYARRLIDHIYGNYRGKGTSMVLGTGDVPGILAFYEKNGFTVSHRIENYFTEHYREPIFEDGVQLIDKVYLKRDICEENLK